MDEPGKDRDPETATDPSAPAATAGELQRPLQWHAAIIEGSRDAIFISDADSRFIAVNQAACDLTGYSRAELLRLRIPDLHEDMDLEAYRQYHDRIMAGEAMLSEAMILRKDGRKVPTEFNNQRITIVGMPLMHTSARDLTERYRVAEALRESEEKYRRLFATVPDAIMVFDAVTHQFVDVNESAEQLYGYTRDEFLQLTHASVTAQLEESNRSIRETLAGGSGTIQLRLHRKKDGTVFPVEISAGHFVLGGRTVLCGVVRDVTERNRTEEQLHHSQKMEAVGRLAGGVAHDFNNLLQVILAQLQLIRAHAEDAERVEAITAELQQHVASGAALTRQLLLFSRRETAKPERFELNAELRATLELLRPLVRENIVVSRELSVEELATEMDRGQLAQILMNLLINACDAMPGGGRIVVRSGARGDSLVWFEVQDTGHGIPSEIRERIFEPFFSTKDRSHGTGLGLSVVHGIVTHHGGSIEVASAPGAGSTFRVLLSRLVAGERAAVGGAHGSAHELDRGEGERILVVEDEAGARVGLGEILGSLGYTVTAVASGEEAEGVFAEAQVDLLLTDLMLPGISGADLAERLDVRFPRLKVILMSGYAQDETVRRGVRAGTMRFLQKPFDMVTLAREVRAALDDR
jgi:two-component system, cell cycle sensor histidine kinase and response regulator CckA